MKNYTITVNGNAYEVTVEEGISTGAAKAPKEASAPAAVKTSAPVKTASAPAPAASTGSVKVEAGAAGKVCKIEVNVGQTVKQGDTIVVVEAMKMEIPVTATQGGTVASIDVKVGETIEAGAILATLN